MKQWLRQTKIYTSNLSALPSIEKFLKSTLALKRAKPSSMISAYFVIGIIPWVLALMGSIGSPHAVLEGTLLKLECCA